MAFDSAFKKVITTSQKYIIPQCDMYVCICIYKYMGLRQLLRRGLRLTPQNNVHMDEYFTQTFNFNIVLRLNHWERECDVGSFLNCMNWNKFTCVSPLFYSFSHSCLSKLPEFNMKIYESNCLESLILPTNGRNIEQIDRRQPIKFHSLVFFLSCFHILSSCLHI